MRIGVLGTGVVSQMLATKLVAVGHDVVMGSRDAANAKAAEWVASTNWSGRAGTFAEAAEHGEIVVNATSGQASLAALELAGAEGTRRCGQPSRLLARDAAIVDRRQHRQPGRADPAGLPGRPRDESGGSLCLLAGDLGPWARSDRRLFWGSFGNCSS